MPLGKTVIRVGAWQRVPHSVVDVDKVKTQLTLVNEKELRQKAKANETVEQRDDRCYIRCWYESPADPAAIYLPRAYQVTPLKPVSYVREQIEFMPVVWPKERTRLRKAQQKPFDALVKKPDRTLGRLLVLRCGGGKTVISLLAAMERGTPIFVLVDSNELAEQWRERIVEHAGLQPHEIGFVGAGVSAWKGFKVTVCLVQTLMNDRRDWTEEFRKYPGVVLFDETHIYGAPVVARCAPLFYGERWAITATENREDGLDLIYRLHFAAKACFVDLKQEIVPSIHLVETGEPRHDIYIFGRKAGKARRWTAQEVHDMQPAELHSWQARLGAQSATVDAFLDKLAAARKGSIPATVSRIADIESRNRRIAKLIRKLEDTGRTILVMGSRTSQLEWFGKHYTGDSGVCYGKIKDPKERFRNLNKHKVVFAQQKMVKKGLDRAEFDTLVLLIIDPELCTWNNVQQSVGRIQRALPGKKHTRYYAFTDKRTKLLDSSLRRLQMNLRQQLGVSIKIKKTRLS